MAQFSTSSIPTLPLLGLSGEEQALILQCQAQGWRDRAELGLSEAFYLGENVVDNLRIAIPKELEFIRPVLGWGAMAVDPYVERLNVDAFRVPTATDADVDIADLLSENSFASEQSLAYTDALSMSPGYWCVGSAIETGGAPRVTVESPLNMSVLWNLQGTAARASLQEYWLDGRKHGAFMVAGKTIELATDDKGQWVVAKRDEHGFDFVPIVRMANRPRTHNRAGRSEIGNPLRYNIANAARTLLGLEVSREIYSVPQRIILGASESSFQKSDGSPKSAWDTYINMVLALERDEDGNLPELKQLQPYDPSVFTKLLDWLASSSAGIVAATPQDMGLYTQGNPASADAVIAGESRRDRRAVNMQNQFSDPLIKVVQMALRFANKGVLPAKYRRLEVDWSPVTMANPNVAADSVSKLVAAGSIPPRSDVTLKRAGFSALERRRMEQDWKTADGKAAAQSIVDALNAAQPPATPAVPGSGNAAAVAN